MTPTPATTQTPVRVQTHQFDRCPVCEADFAKAIETVLGGSYRNDEDTNQQRTCVEPVDPVDAEVARVRLFFHLPEQLAESHDEQAKLDQVMDDE
mgnify:CR=1 FL=1|jgi:hypothetical protein